MEANIVYKNGERRHIMLTSTFFMKESLVADKRTADLSVEKRIVDLANDLGKDVFTITVFRGANTFLEKKFVRNEPPLQAIVTKIDERDIKKKLRKQFKGVPFTQRIIMSEGVWKDIKSSSVKKAA